jgi:hypothetical protein
VPVAAVVIQCSGVPAPPPPPQSTLTPPIVSSMLVCDMLLLLHTTPCSNRVASWSVEGEAGKVPEYADCTSKRDWSQGTCIHPRCLNHGCALRGWLRGRVEPVSLSCTCCCCIPRPSSFSTLPCKFDHTTQHAEHHGCPPHIYTLLTLPLPSVLVVVW